MTKRRNVLIGLASLALGISALRYGRAYLEPFPEFENLDEPKGFRQISGGPSSSGIDPWIGIESPTKQERLVTVAEVRADICNALFGSPNMDQDTVPIASFSDYYCPYCRIQTKRLAELAEEMGSSVRVAWHELPLLGDTSTLAAKAALAAKRQNAYLQFHERLISSPFQATTEYLKALADSIGVDHKRLVSDMNSEAVLREIDTSSALSEIFAFIGTPAMVIGRTVVQGQISDQTLRRLVELEKSAGWFQIC